jgi:hypothetical protein
MRPCEPCHVTKVCNKATMLRQTHLKNLTSRSSTRQELRNSQPRTRPRMYSRITSTASRQRRRILEPLPLARASNIQIEIVAAEPCIQVSGKIPNRVQGGAIKHPGRGRRYSRLHNSTTPHRAPFFSALEHRDLRFKTLLQRCDGGIHRRVAQPNSTLNMMLCRGLGKCPWLAAEA